MTSWRKDPTTRQEKLLLDFVRRMERFREGRRAVHLHLSRLRPYNRREHHLRIAATTFDGLIRKFEGALFRMQNGDMVFVAKDARVEDIDPAVMRLRFLFSEDPLLNNPADEGGFCSWYDLERQYADLLEAAQSLVAAAEAPEDGVPPEEEGEPLDPAHLAQIEKALASADLSPFVRRQAVCFVGPGLPPQALFHELYISIGDLRTALLPRYNLAADRWLFQHLTQALDLRMLALLTARSEVRQVKDFSINLNVATVLSPEFLQFDREMSAEARGTIAIEVQPIDIFADVGAFMFARDFLKERGYKLCIDGLKHLTLPLVNREWLGVDLVKFHWGYDLVDDLGGKRSQSLKHVVQQIGRERLILTRCDSPDAARAGADLGIAMYQGRLFDKQLQEAASAGKPGAAPASPAPARVAAPAAAE